MDVDINIHLYYIYFNILLKQIRLIIPSSTNEQIKISKVIESIDNKIEKEQEKLNSLNEYKKGLLQQMFI